MLRSHASQPQRLPTRTLLEQPPCSPAQAPEVAALARRAPLTPFPADARRWRTYGAGSGGQSNEREVRRVAHGEHKVEAERRKERMRSKLIVDFERQLQVRSSESVEAATAAAEVAAAAAGKSPRSSSKDYDIWDYDNCY